MQIRRLKFFLDIARVKSISKVANNSHISQPALSKQIQKLEESLGKMLFIRSNKGVKLTQAGKIVAFYGENIMKTFDKMHNELHKNKIKELKIAAEPTIAKFCLPCVILKMQQKFPGHICDLISASSNKIEQDLLNDIYEIGFTTRALKNNKLRSKKIQSEKVVLISPYKLKMAEKVKLEDLMEFKFVMCNRHVTITNNLKKALNNKKIDFDSLNVIAQLESIEAVKTLVRSGYGIGFVPYSSVCDHLSDNNLQISIVDDLDLNYNIYINNKKTKLKNNKLNDVVNLIETLYTVTNK